LDGIKEQIVSDYSYDRRNPTDGAEPEPAPDAPAYCAAGNNSDRSVPEAGSNDPMDAIRRALGGVTGQ
jgi:hypothetical protein